jgi:hypothetical protein
LQLEIGNLKLQIFFLDRFRAWKEISSPAEPLPAKQVPIFQKRFSEFATDTEIACNAIRTSGTT